MIPAEEDQERRGTVEGCLYERVAREISTEQQEITTKHLKDLLLYHLKPDKGCRLRVKEQIQTEVDTFMKLMLNCLNQQAQRRNIKRDITSAALEKIERAVLYLPALTDSPSEKESGTLEPATEEESASVSDQSPISDEAVEVIELIIEATPEPDPLLFKLCHFCGEDADHENNER